MSEYVNLNNVSDCCAECCYCFWVGRKRWRRLGGRVSGGDSARGLIRCYSTPASRRAFWRIVSLTAAKTRRMLLVSVACVKLGNLLEKSREEKSTAGRPSYLIVVSSGRIGRGCISLLYQGQDHLN